VNLLRDAGWTDSQIFGITVFVALRLAFSTDSFVVRPLFALPEVLSRSRSRLPSPPWRRRRGLPTDAARPPESDTPAVSGLADDGAAISSGPSRRCSPGAKVLISGSPGARRV